MNENAMKQTIERIARQELEITTLERCGNNEEDFHRLAVWEIETVMELAYRAGFEAAGKCLPAEREPTVKRARTENGRNGSASRYSVTFQGRIRKVTVPENDESELFEAMREQLSPQAIAARRSGTTHCSRPSPTGGTSLPGTKTIR